MQTEIMIIPAVEPVGSDVALRSVFQRAAEDGPAVPLIVLQGADVQAQGKAQFAAVNLPVAWAKLSDGEMAR